MSTGAIVLISWFVAIGGAWAVRELIDWIGRKAWRQ